MVTFSKTIGIGVMAFGCGVLVAFFLPESVLIVLEAGVIVTAGILFSKGQEERDENYGIPFTEMLEGTFARDLSREVTCFLSRKKTSTEEK